MTASFTASTAMLELRPSCEHCDTALPPDSGQAMICSFECTFCVRCVAEILHNVCPNCGGGLWQRPVRPRANWRRENYLGRHPASTRTVYRPVDPVVHAAFAAPICGVPPYER